MKRLLIIISVVLGALLLLAAVAWWWLTTTRGGAEFALNRAAPALDQLAYERLEGGLRGGLRLSSLQIEHQGIKFSAGEVELAATLRLLPLGVRVEHLRVDDGRLILSGNEGGPAEPFEMGDYTAPIEVRIESVEVDRFTFLNVPEAEPLEIERFEFAGRYAEALEIERMALSIKPHTLQASGQLGLDSPWPIALSLALDAELEPGRSQQMEIDLQGELADLAIGLNARGPATLNGRINLRGLPAPGQLNAALDLSGRLSGWPGIDGTIDELQLRGSGRLDDWQAELKGALAWPELPPAALALNARGDSEQVMLESSTIDMLDGRIMLDGEVALAETITAGARLRLNGLDFTAVYPEWPNQARVSGRLDAAWDGTRLSVNGLELHAPPAPLSVTGQGSFTLPDEQVSLALEWQSLTWPPVVDEVEQALFSSRAGTLEASGKISEWRTEIEAWLRLPEQPEARIQLEADGDSNTVQIQQARIDLPEAGAAELAGRFVYQQPYSASLDVQLTDFDPAFFIAELPGRVDSDMVLQLNGMDPIAASLKIRSLSGNLRQVSLTGSGRALLSGDRFEQGRLALALGENRIELASADGRVWQFEVDAERLDQLWPDLSGSVRLSAAVDPVERDIDWTLASPGAAWQDFRAASINGSGRVSFDDTLAIESCINAEDVDLNPWERLDRVEWRLAGDCQRHEFSLYLGGTRATLDLTASGTLPGCLDSPANWIGELDRLQIAETPVGAWQLDRPLSIRLADGVFRADPACLWTTGSDGRFCLNELDAGETGRAMVAFNSVPMDLLLLPMDPVFTLDSDLRGLVQLEWGGDGVHGIESTLLLSEGAVRMLEAEEDLVRIRGSRLHLSSPRPGDLEADLVLRLEQQSKITARARIPNLNALESAELDARANLDLPNLGAFNRLVPQLDRMAGRLEADLRAAGPLFSPTLNGRLALREAGFFYAPLGSRVEDLDLELTADAEGGRLEGGFVAGSGQARVWGDLDLMAEQGWRATAAIEGSELRMFNVKWLDMTVSPDLDLAISPERLDLNGVLTISQARLGMPPGADQRIPASPDVVVAGEEEPEQSGDSTALREMAGELSLILSDDVRLAAAGMETHLAGALDLQWIPGKPMPEGRGTIRLVDGSYRAFGQSLEVTEGDVLFTGNPVDNPVLQIEAVREIFGDPLVRSAGVQIRGPAQDPNIELFTSPPTSREKALAYVLTGADFDHAGGQGAFSVGFWVLPNVFVSYGLGLFDSGNVLAARWELSRRWGLRATSGERDTGADVSFIIDR